MKSSKKGITKVVFRKFENGDIIALFPQIYWAQHGDLCMSYEHVGQHGPASLSIVSTTKLATPEEYQALKKELERIGYNLRISSKVTQKDRTIRYGSVHS